MSRLLYYALAFVLCLAFDPLRKILRNLFKDERKQLIRNLNQKIRYPNQNVSFSQAGLGKGLSKLQSLERETGVPALNEFLLFRRVLQKDQDAFQQSKEIILGALIQITCMFVYFGCFFLFAKIQLNLSNFTHLKVSFALIVFIIVGFILLSEGIRVFTLQQSEKFLEKLTLFKLFTNSQYSVQEVVLFSKLQGFQPKRELIPYVENFWKSLKDWIEGAADFSQELDSQIQELEYFHSRQLKKFQARIEGLKMLTFVFLCVPLIGWNFQGILLQSFGQH